MSNLLQQLLQRPEIRTPIAISFGAIAGALSRYYISRFMSCFLDPTFPYGTLFVNLTGSFGMGFFFTLSLGETIVIPPDMRLIIAVGFLGSYTTFSTYELDTFNLLNQNGWHKSLIYWLTYWFGSAFLGFLHLYLGIFLARLINRL